MAVDRELARQWIRETPGALGQAWAYLRYHWYHSLPRLIPSVSSTGALVLYLGGLAVIIAIASVPIWNKVIKSDGLDFSTLEAKDFFQIGLVAALLFARWVIDSVRTYAIQGKAERAERDRLSLDQIASFKSLFPAVRPPRGMGAAATRDAAAATILRCIHQTVRLAIGKSGKDYLCANLILFSGADGEQADIVARSLPDRDLKSALNGPDLIAYYVAERRAPFVVNDLHGQSAFPRSRPGSENAAPYRSILLLPLLDETTPESRRRCKGVVTIDSSKPFEFWGAIRTDMQVQIQPYLEVLKLLYMKHSDGVPSHA